MNLRTKLFGLAAAVAICLGFAAPAAAVGPTISTGTNLSIGFTDVGGFSVSLGVLTGFDGSGLVTASTVASTRNATLLLTYTDTQAYRDGFNVNLSATDFNSTLQVPYQPAGTFYAIPASGFKIFKNYNPAQTRWTSQGCSATPGGTFPTSPTCLWDYRVGDIGATTQSGGTINPNPFATWTSANELNAAKFVAYGLAGSGTVASTQALDVTLDVPAAMPGTTYTSVVTASLVGTTP